MGEANDSYVLLAGSWVRIVTTGWNRREWPHQREHNGMDWEVSEGEMFPRF
jgi:hypothetical protein